MIQLCMFVCVCVSHSLALIPTASSLALKYLQNQPNPRAPLMQGYEDTCWRPHRGWRIGLYAECELLLKRLILEYIWRMGWHFVRNMESFRLGIQLGEQENWRMESGKKFSTVINYYFILTNISNIGGRKADSWQVFDKGTWQKMFNDRKCTVNMECVHATLVKKLLDII